MNNYTTDNTIGNNAAGANDSLFSQKLANRAAEIEKELDRLIRPEDGCEYRELIDAMRYSLLAGGKRLRPALLLEFYELSGGNSADALPFACALEMIHTYSLIHDDLPCMDDDDLRRGRPTSHKMFGEATALLAGDALLNGAYELMLSAAPKFGENAVAAAGAIAAAAGAHGMVGGQTLDLENETAKAPDEARLRRTDALKTGALFRAACEAGVLLAGGGEAVRSAAVEYAKDIGLAFQVVDDLLDATASESELGKSVGSDAGKRTYLDFLGEDGCRALARELSEKAAAAVSGLPGSEFLAWLARGLAERVK